MKTFIKITLAAFLTLIVCSGFSIAPDTASYNKMPETVKKTLMRQMQFPQEASEQKIEGQVAVCFKVTETGKIEVNCINGHPVLKKAVLEKMDQIKFQDHMAYANKNMYIKFKFDIERL